MVVCGQFWLRNALAVLYTGYDRWRLFHYWSTAYARLTTFSHLFEREKKGASYHGKLQPYHICTTAKYVLSMAVKWALHYHSTAQSRVTRLSSVRRVVYGTIVLTDPDLLQSTPPCIFTCCFLFHDAPGKRCPCQERGQWRQRARP